MCGIAGFVDFSCKLDKEVLVNMTDTLSYRGPDDSGYLLLDKNLAFVGLGHRRLSILDLSSAGHQPMSYGNYCIVYNGEIYNFKEIRKELSGFGYNFSSDSDTEVILKAYDKWGLKFAHRFVGMFSLAILDSKANKLLLFRDRAGVKPLYYYYANNVFLFASELKPFHQVPGFVKSLNLSSVQSFLKLGYIPAPNSIFNNTYKLSPGHFLELNIESGHYTVSKYWDVLDFYNRPKLDITFDEALIEVEKILSSAFQYRMVSDVPVGVFLSGGYDSTAVAALLQGQTSRKINTFSIGFEETNYNEAPHARRVANYLGTNHHEQYCSINEAKDIIPELCTIWDEPFGDGSAIPTVLVSRLASRQVKVALSADAGDEIFAGYDKYPLFLSGFNRMAKMPEVLRRSISKAPLIKLKHVLSGMYNIESRLSKIPEMMTSENILQFNYKVSQTFTNAELDCLLIKRSDNCAINGFLDTVDLDVNDNLNALLSIDYKTYMVDDILMKVDRATMSTSLEGREPMLDHRIIEFVSQLPSHYKISKNGTTKYLLKEIVHRYVPKTMMERKKMGFNAPVESWLKNDLKGLVEYYFSADRISRNGVLDPEYVTTLKNDFFRGRAFNFNKLWYPLVFEMWFEKWMR